MRIRRRLLWGGALVLVLALAAVPAICWIRYRSRPNRSMFVEEVNGRRLIGFHDRDGAVAIPPQFIFTPAEWKNQYLWVWDADCDDTNTCAVTTGCDFSGNFIDETGRKLLDFHAHAITTDLLFDTFPAFDHGLAFVRQRDDHIYGVTEDGQLLPLHETLGPFRELDDYGGQEYIGYDGRCVLVRFLDGRYALLDERHELATELMDDFAAIYAMYTNRLAALDK